MTSNLRGFWKEGNKGRSKRPLSYSKNKGERASPKKGSKKRGSKNKVTKEQGPRMKSLHDMHLANMARCNMETLLAVIRAKVAWTAGFLAGSVRWAEKAAAIQQRIDSAPTARVIDAGSGWGHISCAVPHERIGRKVALVLVEGET